MSFSERSESPGPVLRPKQVLPYVICVEGNIGSGKSTLLTNLSKSGFTVIEEPVTDIWGQYLPQLYEDIKRWGFCFQMEALDWFRQLQSKKFAQILIRMKEQNISLHSTPERNRSTAAHRLDHGAGGGDEDDSEVMGQFESEQKQEESFEHSEQSTSWEDESEEVQSVEMEVDQDNYKKKRKSTQRRQSMSPQKQLLESSWVRQSKRVIIVERSALSCITIFAKNLMEQGNMTKWEFSLLKRFYSMIAWEPEHILYLRVDPEVCCRRIQMRNRKGEESVDPELIHGLHEKHEFAFVRDEVEVVSRRDTLDGICASPEQNVIYVNGHKNADSVLREALFKISKIESRM